MKRRDKWQQRVSDLDKQIADTDLVANKIPAGKEQRFARIDLAFLKGLRDIAFKFLTRAQK